MEGVKNISQSEKLDLANFIFRTKSKSTYLIVTLVTVGCKKQNNLVVLLRKAIRVSLALPIAFPLVGQLARLTKTDRAGCIDVVLSSRTSVTVKSNVYWGAQNKLRLGKTTGQMFIVSPQFLVNNQIALWVPGYFPLCV